MSVVHKSSDWLGIILSSTCAIHCLLTSFFMMSLPLMARYYLSNPYIHVCLAGVIFPLGAFTFIQTYKSHKAPLVLVLGLIGILIVGITPLLTHAFLLPLNEFLWLIIGSLILMLAHSLNLWVRFKRTPAVSK